MYDVSKNKTKGIEASFRIGGFGSQGRYIHLDIFIYVYIYIYIHIHIDILIEEDLVAVCGSFVSVLKVD